MRWFPKPLQLCVVALFVSFFFPWLKIGAMDISLWVLPDRVMQLSLLFSLKTENLHLWRLVYVFPLLTLFTLFVTVIGKFQRSMAILTGGLLLVFFAVVIWKVGLSQAKIYLAYGAYTSLVLATFLIICPKDYPRYFKRL